MEYLSFNSKIIIRGLLDQIESQLRTYIVTKLEELYGIEWWNEGYLNKIRKKCRSWRRKHIADPFRIGDIKEEYEYMSMNDLVDIIILKSKELSDGFTDEFTTHLKDLNKLRDSLAHPTDILVEDVQSCKRAFTGIVKVLSSCITQVNMQQIVTKFNEALTAQITSKISNLPESFYGEFIGRENELEFIETELLEHPNTWMLLIDGIGGIGKSSLAYELATKLVQAIENEESDFEYVIWLSAKNNKLSLDFQVCDQEPDFEELEGLLDSILDFFEINITKYNDINSKQREINNILQMTKCLLVIDNLETISDEAIYKFFDRVPSHNKILLTSRDRRYKLLEAKALPLEGLRKDDTINYIKNKVIKNKIDSLSNASDEILEKIAEKTHGHPLILECLLHQIYMGKPVQSAITDLSNSELDKVFEFCFGSTYGQLHDRAKQILICLALFKKRVKIKEISFICELDYQETCTHLEQLRRFSMVKETLEHNESEYYLLPIIQKYVTLQISKNQVFASYVIRRYDIFKKEMKSITTLENQDDPYFKNFAMTNDFDKLAANMASTALNEYTHSGNYLNSIEILDSALKLSPNSAYVCQIRAFIEKSENSPGESAKWYSKAVEYEEDNYMLWRLWGDLEKDCSSYDNAIEKYKEAVRLNIEDKRAWFGLGICQSKLAYDFWQKKDYNAEGDLRVEAEKSFNNALYTGESLVHVERIHNVRVYHQKAFNLYALQEFEQAKENCKKGLKLDKHNQYLSQLLKKVQNRI